MSQYQNENSNQLFQGEYITGFKVKEVCNPTNQGNDKSSIKSNKIIELNPTSVYDENKILIEIKKEDSIVEDSNEKILQSELEKKKDGKNRLSLEANDKKSTKKGMNIIKKKDKLQKKKEKILETKKNDLTKENKPQQEKDDSSNDKNDGSIFPNLNNNNQRNNNTIVIDLTDDEDILEDFKFKTFTTSIISIVNCIYKIAIRKYEIKLNNIYDLNENIITKDNYKQISDGTVEDFYCKFFKTKDERERTAKNLKKKIKNLKRKEKNNSTEKIKLLKTIFSTKMEDIHQMFLEDKPYLNYKDRCKLFIKMNTLKDYIKYRNFKIKLDQMPIDYNPLSEDTKNSSIIDINNHEKSDIKSEDGVRKKILNRCGNIIEKNIRFSCEKYNIGIAKMNWRTLIKNSFEEFEYFGNRYIRDIFINIKKKISKKKIIEKAIELEEKDDNDKKIIEKAIELEEKDDNDKKIIEKAIESEEKDDNDKKIIEKAIELEEKDDNDKKKVLNKLFNNKIKYSDIFFPFLNNETKIEIKGENGNIIDTFELEFFPTYEESFNEYTKEQREVYKEDLMKIMTGNWISSHPRNIKNKKSKNNKNLGKKKKRERSK